MRLAAGLLVTWLALGTQLAHAGDCIPGGSPPKLNSETVEWTIMIPSGRSCLRGLRSGAMIIDSVTIGAPAKFGQATVKGYAFSYNAPYDFKGDDSFSVTIVGANRGVRGNSTLQVHVTVQ